MSTNGELPMATIFSLVASVIFLLIGAFEIATIFAISFVMFGLSWSLFGSDDEGNTGLLSKHKKNNDKES